MSTTTAYAADIVKAERDADGNLIVYGKATGPDLDLDGQVCDPAWLKSAMPSWMEWGNVREMHQPIAAGVGTELVAEGDDWWVKSKCVDPSTAKKIDEGVLKGYSVGIKNPKVVKDASAPGGRIIGGTIVEVSYVDRPCNPTATMMVCKAAGPDGALQPVDAPEPAGEPVVEDAATDAEPAADTDTEPAAVDAPIEPAPAAKAVDPQLAKRASDIAAEVRALVPDLDKAAPEQDIADAQTAIAIIARLITSEADGLAAGNFSETWDISLLLDAIRSLRYFIDNERGEQAQAAVEAVVAGAGDSDDVVVVELGADPDTAKAATTNPPATEPAPATEYVTKTDLADLVTKAVAEATTASEERIKALEADLAKALAQPQPGGPVLTRTTVQAQAARASDADLMRAQADELKAKAATTDDPTLARGYRERAADLLAKANA